MVRLLGMILLMGLSALGGYYLSPHMGEINWSCVLDRFTAANQQRHPPPPSPVSKKAEVSQKMVTLTNIFLGTDVSGNFATLEDLCKAVHGGGGGRESCAQLR
jgi:hypothetical protein